MKKNKTVFMNFGIFWSLFSVTVFILQPLYAGCPVFRLGGAIDGHMNMNLVLGQFTLGFDML